MNKILYLVFILLVASCSNFQSQKSFYKNSENSSNNNISEEKERNKNLLISLEKTPCFGTCPIYKINISENGNGTYKGIRFVDSIGEYNFNIKELILKKILKKASEINFKDIEEDEYFNSYIKDLPSTIITIKNHRVRYNHQANKQLIELSDYIETLTLEELFIKN